MEPTREEVIERNQKRTLSADSHSGLSSAKINREVLNIPRRSHQMDRNAIEQLLVKSLQDGKMSRAERATLKKVLETDADEKHDRDWLRNKIFATARDSLVGPDAIEAIGWLEDAAGLLVLVERSTSKQTKNAQDEALFSPGKSCRLRIQELIRDSRSTADICVFTITDDRITDSILEAHRRKLKVRVISDNDKADDLGNDVERLRDSGVPVVFDHTPHHMHHKFAVFDNRIVVTGSYNWTRSAARGNHENIVVLHDSGVVRQFQSHFQGLWKEFSRDRPA
jgi:mitochondrial cardiolipin hydrolase